MPNIASILKVELARIARKEVRSELLGLRKAAGVHRAEIAALKRRVQSLEQTLRRLSQARTRVTPAAPAEGPSQALRFSGKGLASQRRRLGMSAEDFGLLVGVSGQSIYNWETGKARPLVKHRPALARLRALGKKAAASQLVLLREGQ